MKGMNGTTERKQTSATSSLDSSAVPLPTTVTTQRTSSSSSSLLVADTTTTTPPPTTAPTTTTMTSPPIALRTRQHIPSGASSQPLPGTSFDVSDSGSDESSPTYNTT